ncbi:MAG: hypothetical protein KGL34_08925, partial [Gammaproteobacteria bacterium]|nr:hypothetical protein [Gammaproteobacteria bacterium]
AGAAGAAPPAAGTGAAAAPAARAQLQVTRAPISLEAQSSEIDYKTNELVFRKVHISQGAMSISADLAHATGLNFDNSHWVFRGNVRIAVNEGRLESATAEIAFADKRLARAVVDGTPAQFSQVDPKTRRIVRGHAARIDYDVRDGIVRMSKDAWLTDGQNEISGETLKYDIAARSVVAAAADQSSHRIHITITPPAADKP